jgi:hypothetical protein
VAAVPGDVSPTPLKKKKGGMMLNEVDALELEACLNKTKCDIIT